MALKHRTPFAIKAVVAFMFSSLLIYWSWAAVTRYIEQPVATFVTYTQGDDNIHIILPHVTMCRHDQPHLKGLQSCRQNASKFTPAVQNCLKDPGFNLNTFLETLKSDMILDIDLKEIRDHDAYLDAFSLTFEPEKDPCLTFNISTFNVTVIKPSRIELFFPQSVTVNQTIKLHTELDYPDACSIHSCYFLQDKWHYELQLRKQKVTRESTRNSPCGKYNKETCYQVKMYQEITEKFQCKSRLFYSGKHLELDPLDYPTCHQSKESAIMDYHSQMNHATIKNSCKEQVSCSRTKFIIDKLIKGTDGKTEFTAGFGRTGEGGNDYEVEHFISYINYDMQSLVGEVGGVLGMFLGFSGLSLGLSFADFIERILNITDEPKSATKKAKYYKTKNINQ